ncbi:MAG: beta strand repeat-containing protein, partial [Bacteroidia bacterium]
MKKSTKLNETILKPSVWLLLLLTLISTITFAQQTNLSTTSTFLNNNGSGNVTFNFQNTNSYPIKITNIAGVVGTAGANTCNVYYKTTPISGAPGNIDAANGWILAMTGNFTGIANITTTVTQPFITGGSLIIPPNTTYGMSIFATSQRYFTITTGPTTISAGGCNMITGTNIGYGGNTPPVGPTITPRGWIGTITFEPELRAAYDLGVSQIDSPTTFCGNTQNVVARVKNYGTSPISNFTVEWSINGLSQTPVNSTQTIDTVGGMGPSSVQVLLGSANFPNNTQTIIKAWTSLPFSTSDTIPINDSSSIVKQPAMFGTYTIGGLGADFATITDASAALSLSGVCGPIVFNVNPSSGPYNAGINFTDIAGTSATNTITFNGNGSTILGTVSPLVSFNNVSYIIIDSFNIVGGTSYAGTGVYVTNQCHHLTFNRNTINVGTTSTSTSNVGFAASGSPTGATTVGNNAQYITFTNNTIIGGYYSATFIGNAGYADNYGHYIANNTFRDFYLYGAYFVNADSSVFTNNDINRASRATVSTLYGIYVVGSRYIKVLKNKLHDFGAASYSAYPIYIGNAVNSLGYETEISNNTIYNIGQTAGIFYGIYSLTTALNKVNIYHNTIAYNVPTASTSAIRGLFLSVAITDVNVRNNIINITGGGTGVKTGIYVTTASASFTSNNNNIIVASTSNNNVGYWAAAARASLADWQTASGQDLNSNDINPQFTNLALGNLKPLSVPLDNLGAAVGVTSDIDNTARSLSTPDIGAYEFTTALSCSGTPDAGDAISSKSYACSNQNFTLSLDNATAALGLTYQWLVSTTGANGTYAPLTNDTLRTFDRAQTATS